MDPLLSFPTLSHTTGSSVASSYDPLKMTLAGNRSSSARGTGRYDASREDAEEVEEEGREMEIKEFLRERLDIGEGQTEEQEEEAGDASSSKSKKSKNKKKSNASKERGEEASAPAPPALTMGGGVSEKKKTFQTFESMRLEETLLKAVKKMGFRYPTPIQRQAIPVILADRDVVAMARTGSGKTAAFSIPLVQKLKAHSNTVGVRSLVIAPTRELVLQTYAVIRNLCKSTDLRICAIVGGSDLDSQFSQLSNNPDVIVATPGRLLHIIADSGLSLKRVEYVVFDEADRLFELGLKLQLHQLLSKMNNTRQTVLVSATMPTELVDFVKVGLSNPEFIRLDTETKISEELSLAFFTCSTTEKEASLVYILRDFVKENDMTVIFACTRHHCEYLQSVLYKCGLEAVVIFGSMDQSAREHNLNEFKKKKKTILVTTDLAARGIDIPMLENVINYDFPTTPKLFIHRVGRAARAGRTGTAFSIVSTEDLPYMVDLYSFLGLSLDRTREDVEKENGEVNDNEENNNTEWTQRKRQLLVRRLLRKYDGIYGSFPQAALDDRCEDVVRLIKDSDDIATQRSSCEKAYKLFSTTRPSASKTSVGKAKSLKPSVHPLIYELMSKEQKKTFENLQKRMSFVDQVRAFKPQQTVFENDIESDAAHVMAKRRNFLDVHLAFKKQRKEEEEQQEQTEKEASVNTEKQIRAPKNLSEVLLNRVRKRQDDDHYVESKTSVAPKRKKAKRTNFKDEQFYISYEPEHGYFEKKQIEDQGYSMNHSDADVFNNALRESTMDLTMDDSDSIIKKRSHLRWDKKSGKYVRTQLNTGERIDAKNRIRNEAGALVKKDDKKNFYAEWKKKTKNRIQLAGEEEEAQMIGGNDYEDGDDEMDGASAGRRGRNNKQNRNKGRKGTDLKSSQQMLRERVKKRNDEENKKVVENIKTHGYDKVKQDFHKRNMTAKMEGIKQKQERIKGAIAKKKKSKQKGRKGR